MNLQEQASALMFAENNRVSRVTPRLFALWDGDTVELSTVMVFEQAGLPQEEEHFRLV
jgi:hypothetical protein